MNDAKKILQELVRDVPDFPKPGIVFKDITPVLGSAEGLKAAVEAMSSPWKDEKITQIVCMESRGFIFGTPMAHQLGVGMVPVRKPGKLPCKTRSAEYALEYGTDTLEIHEDALGPDDRVLIVDAPLATGGTAAATVQLVKGLGAEVIGISFLIELTFLDGRSKLTETPRIEAVLQY
ncbi:MAG: adenine phosphoribosyltransferase [Deltaproteobacteria bacterium]|nr:adenine phosphoribosyltransferase [Deltaproteobacteria bacterium]